MPIGEMLAATVPSAGTLNLDFHESAPEKAVAALPTTATSTGGWPEVLLVGNMSL